MGDDIGLTHHGLYEAPFLGGVEEPLLIFKGRIAVEFNIHVKADRSAHIRVAARLRSFPFATAIDLHTVERDAHAFGKGTNLGHETAGEAGDEIGYRQRRGPFAAVNPVFVGGHLPFDQFRLYDSNFHFVAKLADPMGRTVKHDAEGALFFVRHLVLTAGNN